MKLKSSLDHHIKNIIRNNGYMPIDQFLSIVVPFYYSNQNSLGQHGDFITAPEISQLFGEMIGLYTADFWLKNLSNTNFTLVELGPGRGYLMADFLRATKHVNGFTNHIEKIVLFEISPKLQHIQKQTLGNYLGQCQWINNLEELEDYTANHRCIFIANEFFDALPIKQFQFVNNNWYEICLVLDHNDQIDIKPLLKTDHLSGNFRLNNVSNNAIIEYSIYTKNYLELICKSIKVNSGLALFIDYGYVNCPYTSTIQAVKNHKKIGFLESIGEADITYLVNFAAMQQQAIHRSLATTLLTQKEFLKDCGIQERAQQLIKMHGADPKKIENQLNKLLSDEHMGDLFKVLIMNNNI